MNKLSSNIGFIGSGNMAAAIIKGLIGSSLAQPENIFIYDIDKEKSLKVKNEFGVVEAQSDIELVNNCNVIIPAVKPQYIIQALRKIKSHLMQDHLVISIAAGISISTLKEAIENKCDIIRTMPNTPAFVGEGMTAICIDNTISDSKMSLCKSLFKSIGYIEMIQEQQIHAATAISGSSPAYGFAFIEALADGGVLLGLPREQSYRMAAQALLGAAKMVLETGQHPGSLKDMVCSPGGTTIEAIASLESDGFRSSVIEAMRLCAQKSELLGRNNSK